MIGNGTIHFSFQLLLLSQVHFFFLIEATGKVIFHMFLRVSGFCLCYVEIMRSALSY